GLGLFFSRGGGNSFYNLPIDGAIFRNILLLYIINIDSTTLTDFRIITIITKVCKPFASRRRKRAGYVLSTRRAHFCILSLIRS
ncbi:MAG TPA: hypothetical protein PKJ47_10495, partial [Candidatus Limiplasma sp.]|nr:hypothetical protein [Candidatus Limiplasma sp.]